MAQRVLKCPSCGAGVEVPDNYFRANIACFQCGAQLDRRTGGIAGSGHAAPPGQVARPASQQQNRQAAPGQRAAQPQQHARQGAPGQYSAQPQQYASQPGPAQYSSSPYGTSYPQYGPPPQYGGYQQAKTGKPTWMIVLLILVPVVVVGILALAAIPLITSGGISASAVNSWPEYRSAHGRYTIRMPIAPKESSKTEMTPLGPRVIYAADAHYKLRNFGVGYFDLGEGPVDDYTFDYRQAASGMASVYGGTIVEQGPAMVSGQSGHMARIQQKSKRFYTRVHILRYGNRIYFVLAEAYTDDQEEAVKAFMNTFRIDP